MSPEPRLAPYQIDPDGRHLKGKSNVADLQVGAAICRFDQGTPFLRARHAEFMDLQKAEAVRRYSLPPRRITAQRIKMFS